MDDEHVPRPPAAGPDGGGADSSDGAAPAVAPAPLPGDEPGLSEQEEMLHELRVSQYQLELQTEQLRHAQIELEMQNEELYRAQLEVERSQELYAQLFDNAPVGHLVLDGDGTIVDINETAAHLLEMHKQALTGRRFYELVQREDRDQLYLVMRRAQADDRQHRCEMRLRRTLGTGGEHLGEAQYFWAEVRAQPVEADATPRDVRVTFTDIDGRRRAELARDEATARFTALFRNSPLPMSLTDLATGTWLDVNPAWESLTGVSYAEAIGRTSVALGLVADVEKRADVLDRLRGGTGADTLFRLCLRSGEERNVAVSAVPLDSPDGLIALSILRDLTEDLRAYEALQRSKQELQATFDSMLDPVVRLDAVRDAGGDIADFVFADANEAACAFNALPRDELVGTSLLQQHPAAAAELLGLYREVVETGRPLVLDDWSYAQDMLGGERRHYDVRAVRIGDGLMQTWRDVTERVGIAERLRRHNEQLDARVTRRTAELAAANRELEAFTYSVSHDLRAPLRAIDGFSEMVLEDAADKLSADDVEHLSRVRRAAQRMAALIDAMLALSRATRTPLVLTDVDLSAAAAGVLDDLQAQDPTRVVKAVVTPGLHAQGDPALLRTVLANLLSNAWKFTGRHATARIEFGACDVDGERAFFVRDDGAGFEPAYAGKLFGAFQRAHSPGEYEGEGIGLANVQRLVSRHGGRVWAEGAVEKGATFFFTLPPQADDEAADDEPADDEPADVPAAAAPAAGAPPEASAEDATAED